MDVTSLSALNSAPTQNTGSTSSTSAKLQSVIDRLVNTAQPATSDNVAQVSIAAQLQSSSLGLKQISGSLAQAGSLTQVASSGVSQINEVLQQLQSLADQADTPSLSPDARAILDQQFQKLSAQIDQIANNTSFNSQPLLTGNVSGSNSLSLDTLLNTDSSSGSDTGLTLPNLSSSSLFGNQSLNLLSDSGVQQSLAVVGSALGTTSKTSTAIAGFQQAIDFVSASVDAASANQQAATSTLSDADLDTTGSSQLSLANLQQNLGSALAAQGNNLNPSLLGLIN